MHACGLCAYKDHGSIPDHGSHDCPKKAKRKKKANF
jgi:hypothetical protein